MKMPPRRRVKMPAKTSAPPPMPGIMRDLNSRPAPRLSNLKNMKASMRKRGNIRV